jgi:hypothetical protein
VLSPTYAIAEFSTWTRRELVLADNASKPVIPVTHTGMHCTAQRSTHAAPRAHPRAR